MRRYSNHWRSPLKTDHRQRKKSNDHYSLIPRTIITQSPSCWLRGTHQKKWLHWRPLLLFWLLNQSLQMVVFAVHESTSFLGWEKFLPCPLLSCFEVKEKRPALHTSCRFLHQKSQESRVHINSPVWYRSPRNHLLSLTSLPLIPRSSTQKRCLRKSYQKTQINISP